MVWQKEISMQSAELVRTLMVKLSEQSKTDQAIEMRTAINRIIKAAMNGYTMNSVLTIHHESSSINLDHPFARRQDWHAIELYQKFLRNVGLDRLRGKAAAIRDALIKEGFHVRLVYRSYEYRPDLHYYGSGDFAFDLVASW